MMIGIAAWPYRSFGDCLRASFVWCFAAVLLCMASLLPSARCAEPPAQPAVAVSDQPGTKAPGWITGNPAGENEHPRTGPAGRLLQLTADSGRGLAGFCFAGKKRPIPGWRQPG